jgi:protein-histidine pros-kinase
VVVLFTAAFILLVFMYILIQKQAVLRRRIAAMMSDENVRLERLIKKRTAELNDLATYLTRLSEAEKRHIAQELHDEMGALLTAARMDTTWIIRDLEPAIKDKYARRLARLSESIDAAISLKRKITTNLKPPLLQELGLIESLRAMTEDMTVDGDYKVDIDLPDNLPSMDDEKTLAVFRIFQESLTNIRKYANASRIQVCIRVEDGRIRLLISDDGLGFDPTKTGAGGHGISGMRHRAQMFGGNLRVQSAPGKGTQIKAYIPV